jgi:crossover junction endodeoxyribonuclease ruvC
LKILDAGILLQKKVSPTREDQYGRMLQIADFFTELFEKYQVHTVSMEKLFFTKYNQNNAEFVFGIRAILLTMAMKKKIQIREFTPIELKKYIT